MYPLRLTNDTMGHKYNCDSFVRQPCHSVEAVSYTHLYYGTKYIQNTILYQSFQREEERQMSDYGAHHHRREAGAIQHRQGDCSRTLGSVSYTHLWFAATILGLDVRSEFKKVLVTIIQDLNLKISIEYRGDTSMKAARSTYPKQSVEQSQKRCTGSMDKVEYIANKKSFRVYERPFTQKELAFWEQYGISLETLEQYHVKSLSCYESVSREGKPFKPVSYTHLCLR